MGQTYTPASILARNMGTTEDQETQFPPHKIIGNIYYVGTKTLRSFLIVTPQGNILIDSTYERNVPDSEVGRAARLQVLRHQDPARQSRARRSHGRRRHGQAVDRRAGDGDGRGRAGAAGDEAWRQGAPDRQGPARRRIGHPRRHDARRASDARATRAAARPGRRRRRRTARPTTWCSSAACAPAGRSRRRSRRSSTARSQLVRALPCDVPLGDHPAQYNMQEKYAKLKGGGPNPFIDKANCLREADIQEAMYHAVVAEQKAAAHQ